MIHASRFKEVQNHRPEFYLDPVSGQMFANAQGTYGIIDEGKEVIAAEWKEEKYYTQKLNCLR